MVPKFLFYFTVFIFIFFTIDYVISVAAVLAGYLPCTWLLFSSLELSLSLSEDQIDSVCHLSNGTLISNDIFTSPVELTLF